MEQIKEIGKVKLDYRHYSGTDLYSDGEVEAQILDLVSGYSKAEYPRMIEESLSWPVLYHLSSLRSNTIEWLPIHKDSKVLEIGSGCGAITDMLAEKAGEVVCVDLSDLRSRINATRNKEKDNITIHVGNFQDIEPDLPTDFDFILLIGVFEYSGLYIDTGEPYQQMLRIMKKHLHESGRLIIAIENRLGLKYWAGAAEDHLGTYFGGIEGYQSGEKVRTFTRTGLEKILKDVGIGAYSFYYPYPDYKFMTTLYSDRRLPFRGELTDNLRNFDRDRLVLFNEKYAFDSMIADGLFPDYANSYLVVIGKEPETVYMKYSNDRVPEYVVRTEITGATVPTVRKTALAPEAVPHVIKMEESYHALSRKYAGTSLAVNRCERGSDGISVIFEYIDGITLEERLDQCLEREDQAGFAALFERFWSYVNHISEETIANFDFAFSNILISGPLTGEEQWTLIDYEWIAEREISPAEVAYRAVHCYLLAEEKRNRLDTAPLMAKMGITPDEAALYRNNEKLFQKMVTGSRKSMGDIRATCGTRALVPQDLVRRYLEQVPDRQVQIYFDRGEGFREEESRYLPEVYLADRMVHFELDVDEKVRSLRLDPADEPCLVRIKHLLWNDREIPVTRKNVEINGKLLKDGYYAFATRDPNITLELQKWGAESENRLVAELEIVKISEELAAEIVGSGKKWFS